MSKNPFVNCKSRKRRKVRYVKPKQDNVFCPRTMVRYTNSPNEYKTVWICKMCMTCILSEEAVNRHINDCKERIQQNQPSKNSDEDTRYICGYCNRMFSRQVALKKHQEEHEKDPSVADSGDSDDEFVLFRKRIKTGSNKTTLSSNLDTGNNEVI